MVLENLLTFRKKTKLHEMFIETMTVNIYKKPDFFGGKSELLVTNGKMKYVACLQFSKCIIYSYFIPLCCLL